MILSRPSHVMTRSFRIGACTASGAARFDCPEALIARDEGASGGDDGGGFTGRWHRARCKATRSRKHG